MYMQESFSDGFAVQVPAGTSMLDAELQVPHGSMGLIIMSHAGCRTTGMQRVQNLSDAFIKQGFGILMMDLLTEEETEIGKPEAGGGTPDEWASSFDSEMLAERLYDSLDWVRDLPESQGLPIGLFGSGPGAWAAFAVAAAKPIEVGAVVASALTAGESLRALARVKAPTLILAGADEGGEGGLARDCYAALSGRKRMECIAGLGQAPGRDELRATEKMARFAAHWFTEYLR
jgi:putative phosphoribosyl transferase